MAETEHQEQQEEEAKLKEEEAQQKQKQSEELQKEEMRKTMESMAAHEHEKQEEERKRLREAVVGDVGSGQKKARVDEWVLGTAARISCDVVLRGSGPQATLHLRNSSETNKKIPKETILLTWKEGTKLSHESDTNFAYDLTMQTEIVCRDTLKKFRLNKYIKEHQKSVKEVYGYVPFPSGSLPKVLVKKEAKALFFLTSDATDGRQIINAAIEAARISEGCSLHWIMKLATAKERLEPCGLALATCKPLVVPGSGELGLGS